MHTMSRGGRRAACVLPWALTVAVLACCWPVPALHELMGPAPAYAADSDDTTGDSTAAAPDAGEMTASPTADDEGAPAADAPAPAAQEDEKPGDSPESDAQATDLAATDSTSSDDEGEVALTAQATGEGTDTLKAANGEGVDGPNVWIDDRGRDTVFSDGTLSLWIRQDGPIEDPYKLYVNVGPWDKYPGEDGFDWADGFKEGKGYTFDEETGELCLDGVWLSERDYDYVKIFVAVGYEPEGQEEEWTVLEGGDGRWINVREPVVEYDRAWDRDLLPGWDGSVDGRYNVWVENSDHPEGDDLEYDVTDVEVISGEEFLEDFHVDSDDVNHWWYYRAGDKYGTATLKVTYEIPEELGSGTGEYTFDLNVSGDVYDLDIWWDEVYGDNILPGTTVDLYTHGTHHRDGQEDTDEGLTYTWELREGEEAGTLTVDPNDPQHATFTADSPSDDGMDLDDFVHVRVYLYDGGNEPVAESGWAFNVRSAFCEIFPATIKGDLGIGQSENVTFELRSYLWDDEASTSASYTTIDGAELYFWYDPNCVSITDGAGNEVVDNSQRDPEDEASYPVGAFTITRTGDWHTDINVRAVWYESGERYETWRNLWLDNLDYRLWFEGDHDLDVWVTRGDDDSYSNPSDVSNAVSLSDSLEGIDGLEIEWTVGTWDNDSYQQTFGLDSGLYSVSDDGLSITADAAAMAEQDIWDLRVIATAKLGDQVTVESDNDFWFHLRERVYDPSFPRDAWMLPGWRWGGWIQDKSEVYLEDEGHDGEHLRVTVTDVSIDDEDVAVVEKDGDSWTIEAIGYGDATVTITYTDFDGIEGRTWTLPVSVSSDVYNVNVSVTSGDTWALPGETIPLAANGWHDYEDEEGHHCQTAEGLTYEWSIEGDGQDVAIIVPSDDGQSATVTFNERPDNVDWWQRGIWVRVILFDADEHGQPQQVAENGIDLMVIDDYYVITPYEPDFPSDTAVGSTFTLKPELLLRRASNGEVNLTDESQFEICFDPKAIRVSGATVAEEDGEPVGSLVISGGESFEITRLRNWGTDIHVNASWTDESGRARDDNRMYRLNDLWHDCDGALVKVDAKAATLDAEGNIEHWRCDTCGGYFLDEEGRDEVAREVVTIPQLIDIAGATVSGVADKTYSGSAFTQAPVVKMGGETLVAGTDYVVGGTTKATNAGSYTITITGKGIYGGTKSISYKIEAADISKATVSGIANKTYNGSAQTQAPTVKVGSATLKGGTDYTVGYKNNTNAGTATVTITGKGNYTGTKDATFTIAKAKASSLTVAAIDEQGYTGAAIKPAPTVKLGSVTLKSGTDYTLSYKSNKAVGTATVTVTGKGNYTGTKTASFKIVNWAGANRIPVSATAKYTLLRGGYMRVLVNGKKATSDAYVSISGATVTGKKAGKTVLYLYDKSGKQVAKKAVTVFVAHGKTFEFESSVDRNYVLDIQGGSKSNGAQMIVYQRNGGKNQRYTLYLQSDGTYGIKSVNSGRYLTVETKTSKYVQQWAWRKVKNPDQRWRLTVDSSNRATFVNVATNKCFDVQGGKTTNSAKMIVWQSNNGLNQKWKLNQK